jgi:hypothetical protein
MLAILLGYGQELARGFNPLLDPSINKDAPVAPYDKSLRVMLQTLGTEWGRHCIDPDIWVIKAAEFIARNADVCNRIVFSDVRFNNEAQFIKDAGGLIVHVVRDDKPTIDNENHVSEAGILAEYIDVTVHNNGTLNDLVTTVEGVFNNYDRMVALRQQKKAS